MKTRTYNALVNFTVSLPADLAGVKTNENGERYLNVIPPIIEGHSDSIWVHSSSDYDTECIRNAERKLALGYGIVGLKMRKIDGFWYTYKG